MAVDAGFDTHELDELARQMYRVAEERYPKEAKAFLKDQGNKGRRVLRAKTKAATQKKTGNLLRGIGKGPVHKRNGDFQVRVYNKAPHAHLIEHGHVFYHRGKKTEKFVPGKHPAADATKELKAEFPRDAEAFVDRLIKEGFEL